MKKLSRHELMQYGTAIISFLIVMTFTLLIFSGLYNRALIKVYRMFFKKHTAAKGSPGTGPGKRI